MKNIEKAIIICIVLSVLRRFPYYLMTVTYLLFDYDTLIRRYIMHAYTVTSYAFLIVAHLGVGIWLFMLAKREKVNPWIWFLFAFFLGPITAVLFFLWKAKDDFVSADINPQLA